MKKDKEGYVVITVLMIIVVLLAILIVESIANKEKSYEYALNGEIGVSNNCYLKEDIAYCEVDNTRIQVDNYYEVNSE